MTTIKPAHIRHLLPLGLALTTGAALAPVVGWSLIAFVCSAAPKNVSASSAKMAMLDAVADMIEVFASVACFVYALWLAVHP